MEVVVSVYVSAGGRVCLAIPDNLGRKKQIDLISRRDNSELRCSIFRTSMSHLTFAPPMEYRANTARVLNCAARVVFGIPNLSV